MPCVYNGRLSSVKVNLVQGVNLVRNSDRLKTVRVRPCETSLAYLATHSACTPVTAVKAVGLIHVILSKWLPRN